VNRSTLTLLAAAMLAALSMVLPDSNAQSAAPAAPMTAKQAQLKGLAVTAKSRPEPTVGRMIVKLRGDSLGATAQSNRATRMKALESTAGAEMAHERDLAGGAALLSLKAPMTLSEAKAVAARLVRDPAVEYAEPDIMMKRAATPNEPRFIEWQWNLFAPTATYTGTATGGSKSSTAVGGANLELAWDLNTGSSSVVAAVIDTGIVNHTDLNGAANADVYVPAGRFLAGYDFISSNVGAPELPANFVANDGNGRDPDASDPGDWITAQQRTDYAGACDDPNAPAGDIHSSWHGSHMAGVLAATANNSTSPTTGGIAGVAWNVRVLPVRALGRCGGSLSDIAEAIRWAAGQSVLGVPANPTPAQVISLSLGGGDTCSSEMQNAVNAAIVNGSVIVAAIGNGGEIGAISPANCNGVIGVTAHTINGENADYANIGTSTAISAPGGGTPTLLGAGGPTDDASWQGYYIWSTLLFGDTSPTSTGQGGKIGPAYGGFTGTSAATPHVAGVAALIKSIDSAATTSFISAWLSMASSVRPHPAGGFCNTYVQECGRGLIDAQKASQAASVGAPAVSISASTRVVAPGGVINFNGTASAYGSKSLMTPVWSTTSGTLSSTTGSTVALTTPASPPVGAALYATVMLSATDSANVASYDAILVRVNRVPTLNPVTNQSATVGQTLSFTVTATDADNDPVTFDATSASTAPVSALDPTGQFTWDTTGVAAGSYQLVHFATDGFAQSATQTVTITITAAAGGVPPPTGGGGNGALPLPQLLLLAALLLAARIKRREDQAQ
jgi:serine protease